MNKDLLRTIGGILVIGGIVVATFLYGNQQRQEQVRQDQAQTQTEEQAAPEEPAKPKVVSQQPTPGAPAANGQTQPVTTPETGSELAVAFPLGLLIMFGRWHRSSQLALRTAALR